MPRARSSAGARHEQDRLQSDSDRLQKGSDSPQRYPRRLVRRVFQSVESVWSVWNRSCATSVVGCVCPQTSPCCAVSLLTMRDGLHHALSLYHGLAQAQYAASQPKMTQTRPGTPENRQVHTRGRFCTCPEHVPGGRASRARPIPNRFRPIKKRVRFAAAIPQATGATRVLIG